jgi:hypothetical protein
MNASHSCNHCDGTAHAHVICSKERETLTTVCRVQHTCNNSFSRCAPRAVTLMFIYPQWKINCFSIVNEWSCALRLHKTSLWCVSCTCNKYAEDEHRNVWVKQHEVAHRLMIIFNCLGSRWGWLLSLKSRPPYPRYPVVRKLGGLQSRSGRGDEEKSLLPLPGMESQLSSP